MSRKALLALFAAIAPVALSACARPADQARVPVHAITVAALRAAPDAAAAAGSAHVEVRIGAASSSDLEDGDVVATGGFAGQDASIEVDLGGFLDRAAATTPGASIPTDVDTTMRVVKVGGSVYLQVPMLQGITGTAGWLSLTPHDLGSLSSSFGMAAGALDPSAALEVLRQTTADVDVVGSEVVRGISTTHLRALTSASDQPGDPVDVWIDDEGLVRRFRTVADDVPAALGGGGSVVTIEVFDYGTPVRVEAPPAGDVVPFADLLGSLGRAGA